MFDVTPRVALPFVAGDLVTVMPGETVFVEASLKDGALVDLRAVREVANPARTLKFTLEQPTDLNEGHGMLLTVESPFPGVLKYRLGMMLPDGDRLRKTSACPLHQGAPTFESWPHPIFQIVATDFRSVDPESEEAQRCE